MASKKLEKLEFELRRLPGVGKKTAQRLAFFLINGEKADALNLAKSIEEAVISFKQCSKCNYLSESDPCEFCSDLTRDNNSVCIVESSQDVILVEKTNLFHGRYFVLGNLLSPLDGIGPTEIHFSQLLSFIKELDTKELILAIDPSTEGETTINFIADECKQLGLKITRLSIGLPFGGNLEYTNSITIANAFNRRFEV
jgi:recombination protein RecR